MTHLHSTPIAPRSAGVPLPPDPAGPDLPQPGGVPLPEPEQEPWQDPADPYRKINQPPDRPGMPIEVPEPSLPA